MVLLVEEVRGSGAPGPGRPLQPGAAGRGGPAGPALPAGEGLPGRPGDPSPGGAAGAAPGSGCHVPGPAWPEDADPRAALRAEQGDSGSGAEEGGRAALRASGPWGIRPPLRSSSGPWRTASRRCTGTGAIRMWPCGGPPWSARATRRTWSSRSGREPGRHLDRIVLEMPVDPSWQPWTVGGSLPLIFTGRLILEVANPMPPPGSTAATAGPGRGDRHACRKAGTLREPELRLFTFTTSQALPFVKNDLALVYVRSAPASGRPGRAAPGSAAWRLEPGESGYVVQLVVPDQPRVKVNRLVVQGSDYTKAKAVLRETQLEPGAPLDLDRLSRAQTNLGNLGAFQRLDLMNLEPGPGGGGRSALAGGGPLPAGRRALALGAEFELRLRQEPWLPRGRRSPAARTSWAWAGPWISASGPATPPSRIRRCGSGSPRDDFNRSVDSYSIGYTDPWFLPGGLKGLISDRVQYRAEAAYIEETQAAFLAHRRRVSNSFDWKVGEFQTLRLGHRFERTDIKGNVEGIQQGGAVQHGRGSRRSDGHQRSLLPDHPGHGGTTPSIPSEGTYLPRPGWSWPTSCSAPGRSTASPSWTCAISGTGPSGSRPAAGSSWPPSGSARRGPPRPTVEDLPLTERFFAGGPFTVRGVEPDMLGPVGTLGLYSSSGGTAVQTGTKMIPLGGQGLVVLNLEYRFPTLRQPDRLGRGLRGFRAGLREAQPEAQAAGGPGPLPASAHHPGPGAHPEDRPAPQAGIRRRSQADPGPAPDPAGKGHRAPRHPHLRGVPVLGRCRTGSRKANGDRGDGRGCTGTKQAPPRRPGHGSVGAEAPAHASVRGGFRSH